MVDVQRLADLLALNQNLNLTVFQNGIVDLFAFLGADVADVLRRHLRRVEHIVTEYRVDERHDKCRLGGFFRLNRPALLPDLGR
ncbi:hypothetical protein D3C84_1180240 [compost metagenome]